MLIAIQNIQIPQLTQFYSQNSLESQKGLVLTLEHLIGSGDT